MISRFLFTFVLLLPFVLSCRKVEAEGNAVEQERAVMILVFRYHPCLLEPEQDRVAQNREIDLIHKTAEVDCDGYFEEGGLGHGGYQLFISSRQLGRWKSSIDKLMKSGQLRIYKQWDVDRDGFGFTPIR
jgi:hypothetical protein